MKTFQTFEPVLKQFCEDTKDIDIGDDFSTVFLPHTMPEYSSADKKMFYIGRDTYGWTETDFLMQCYKDNNLDNFFTETKRWANNYKFLDYNNNAAYGFWTLVLRLHLRLKGIKEKVRISSDISAEHLSLLNDFGWGNTNSIEVPESLKKQKIWDNLDKTKYWEIKNKSKQLDKLKYIVSAYKPDIIFIFNWNCSEEEYLKDLNYKENKTDLIGGYFCDYELTDIKTKIFWAIHPNYAKFISYNLDELIDELVEYIEKNNR